MSYRDDYNILYTEVDIGNNKNVDIYSSVNLSKDEAPVILYIHGGAWVAGHRYRARNPCESLAEKGYVCIVPEYCLSRATNNQIVIAANLLILFMLSLAVIAKSMKQMMTILVLLVIFVSIFVVLWDWNDTPPIQHPDHIMDIAAALKWTRDNIHHYGGNPKQIHIMGYSAGAHLAALLTTNTSYMEMLGVSPSIIQSCVCISGIYSDKRLGETPLGQQLLQTVFGRRNQYYDAFAIYNVSAQTPPFLLINADIDLNLKRHSFDFHYCLRQTGVYSEIQYYDKVHHWNILQNENMIENVANFIQEVQSLRS